MKASLKISPTFFFLFALILVLPIRQIYAYLDPGSGSYMLQLIIAGIASILISIKMFWRFIKGFFIGLFFRSKSDPSVKTVEKEKNNDSH